MCLSFLFFQKRANKNCCCISNLPTYLNFSSLSLSLSLSLRNPRGRRDPGRASRPGVARCSLRSQTFARPFRQYCLSLRGVEPCQVPRLPPFFVPLWAFSVGSLFQITPDYPGERFLSDLVKGGTILNKVYVLQAWLLFTD